MPDTNSYYDPVSEVWLRKAWLRQIAKEYDQICSEHQLPLAPPVFSLSDGTKTLGQWSPGRRILSLSADLIRTAHWGWVLEVLRHEIAHQLVSELFGREDEGHGIWFKKACRMVGANPAVYGAYISRDAMNKEQGSDQSQSPEQRLFRKVRKLLALAGSANQNEAALALSKARKLCEEFGLDSTMSDEDPSHTGSIITHQKKKIELWQNLLGGLLMEHFSVQVIIREIFDAQTLEVYKCFELLGLDHKVKIARYIYWFVANRLPGYWSDYKLTQEKSGIRARNQFYQGLITGLKEQLSRKRQNEQTGKKVEEPGQRTPAVAQSRALEAFVQARYPRIVKSRSSYGISDQESYEAGKKRGHTLNLYGGISENSGKRQSLPPGASGFGPGSQP